MADNVSRLRGAAAPSLKVAGEAIPWPASGVPNSGGAQYGEMAMSWGTLGTNVSRNRGLEAANNAVAGVNPEWDPSGLPRPRVSTYQPIMGMTLLLLGDASKECGFSEANKTPAGVDPAWNITGPACALPAAYSGSGGSTIAPVNDAWTLPKTPDPKLPIVSHDVVTDPVMYFLRARDSSLPLDASNKYVYWASTLANVSSYSGVLPGTGPLVDLVILSTT